MARNPNRFRYKVECVVTVVVRTPKGIVGTKVLGKPLQLPSDTKRPKEAASEAAYRILTSLMGLPRPVTLKPLKLSANKRWHRYYEAFYGCDVVEANLRVLGANGRDSEIMTFQEVASKMNGLDEHHFRILVRGNYLPSAQRAARTE